MKLTKKQKHQIEEAKTWIAVLAGFYMVFSIVAFFGGVTDAYSSFDAEYHTGCYSKTHSRLGKIFPAYDFGCYMGVPAPDKPEPIPPSEQRVGIVHDYIFNHATKQCKDHGGLHYVVAQNIITGSEKDYYPCHDVYKFRCQDQSLFDFDDGIGYCGISESQIKESLGQ